MTIVTFLAPKSNSPDRPEDTHLSKPRAKFLSSHARGPNGQWAADPIQAIRDLSSKEVSQPTGYRQHDIHAKKAVAELTP